jgi:hypothetical protein
MQVRRLSCVCEIPGLRLPWLGSKRKYATYLLKERVPFGDKSAMYGRQ